MRRRSDDRTTAPTSAKRRLAILQHAEEVTGNVARTCRYYGVSRQCFYTWQRRYEAEGLDGLRDRSSRPHFSPLATHTVVVGKIVYLRQHYHFGPHKIAMYLARYHDISISPSGVWRILKRLDLNRLPANQRHKTHDRRWKRYEKPLPGHQIQGFTAVLVHGLYMGYLLPSITLRDRFDDQLSTWVLGHDRQ